MAVNADKPDRWKRDIAMSVDFYNQWFIQFAPKAYRDTRVTATKQVEDALASTSNLTDIAPLVLRSKPQILEMLRMATAPPIARDRLIGLSGASANLIRTMELDRRVPPTMSDDDVTRDLQKVGVLILKIADRDIFTWLDSSATPPAEDVHRAATIVADRLCGAQSDPIIRNAQEKRQLAAIKQWLEARRYAQAKDTGQKLDQLKPGTFAFRLNVPISQPGGTRTVNIPVDVAIMPRSARSAQDALLVEAKSAGDFTNPNKRRKEEATKVTQLRHTYGPSVRYILFLCGYFDSGYLGYEAAEGIDWVWEHRIDELADLEL